MLQPFEISKLEEKGSLKVFERKIGFSKFDVCKG